MFAMLTTILLSILGDVLLGIWLYTSIQTMREDIKQTRIESRVEQSKFQRQIDTNNAALKKALDEQQENNKSLEQKSKEGTVWMLRHDILYWIDTYEMKKSITQAEYHRLNDEYNYYKSIGGNYDVSERWQVFKEKIVGTREITMLK